jgi:hypothetical protein
MTAEQFTAFLANLSVGTFLNKTAYAGLTADQKADYDVRASQVAMAFRAKNPNGLTVSFPIDNINTTEKGVAIVVHPAVAPTKNKVFQYAGNYVANMTKKAGIPDVATLNLIHASSLDDNYLQTTFVVAIKGESYTNRSTGEIKQYESTTLRNVDDSIVLGVTAKNMLKEVAMDELRNAIRGASKSVPINRNRIAVDAEPEVEHNEEPAAEEQL